jgi:membrane protease YdiL (CAAX protease family)
MVKIISSVLADIGLGAWPSFLKDRFFMLALFAGVVAWIMLWFTVIPTFTVDWDSIVRIIILTVIWYPLLEEILFRGIIQNYLFNKSWGSTTFASLSVANCILLVIPSLPYGFFRDRFSSIYPSILLHSFYNAGFVGLNIIGQ